MSRAKRPKKKRRGRPSKTAKEAATRWGFCGKTKRLGAYTAEHLAADVAAGVVQGDVAFIRERHCPQTWAEDCTPGDVPLHYRSTRTTIDIDTAGERPRRWRRAERVVCFDCRAYQSWRERREFAAEHGEHELDGYARPPTLADSLEIERIGQLQHTADMRTIKAVGDLDEPLEWYDVRILGASIRHALAEWAAALSSAIAPV